MLASTETVAPAESELEMTLGGTVAADAAAAEAADRTLEVSAP